VLPILDEIMTESQKKARKSTWSPAARAKRAATIAARKAAGISIRKPKAEAVKTSAETFREITVYLEHAEKAILKSGAKRISKAESYAMLALTTLRGG
jgi:hypothetical protein